jgi:hypothetical protein
MDKCANVVLGKKSPSCSLLSLEKYTCLDIYIYIYIYVYIYILYIWVKVVAQWAKAPGIHCYIAGSIPAVTPRYCTNKIEKCSLEHKKKTKEKNIYIYWNGSIYKIYIHRWAHLLNSKCRLPVINCRPKKSNFCFPLVSFSVYILKWRHTFIYICI